MPQRIELIKNWLQSVLQLSIGSLEPASSDASFRRYFRVSFDQIKNSPLAKELTEPFYIVMDAPPDKENISPFIAIATYLEQTGVHVPHIVTKDEVNGFILMTDLGTEPYLSLLTNNASAEQADQLYQDAMHSLLMMQTTHAEKKIQLPVYDSLLLQKEMQLLPDWYVTHHLEKQLSDHDKAVYQRAMDMLITSAQEQPQVFVHRDYHSRNLMYLADNNPGIIDFQDAVIGPITYDLVSLLRDSYIAWPQERVYAWVENYRQKLLQAGLLSQDNQAQFFRWFDWMGVQRQLKVVGIFSRLHYRDGKSNYLNDIPLTLNYLFDVCAKYTELSDLNRQLTQLTR